MRTRKWMWLVISLTGAVMLAWNVMTVRAAQTEKNAVSEEDETSVRVDNVLEELLHRFEFTELEELLRKIFPEQQMTFRQLLGTILEGDLTQAGNLLGIWCKDRLFYEIRTGRNTLKQLLLLAILAAILTNFSGLVRNRHISDIGFYLIYLMVITLSVSSFAAVLESAKEQMHLLTEFLKVLAPVYIFAVGLTCGLTTSAMFYHMLLVLIYLIELVAVQFLLPIIHVQVLVGVLNNLSEEDYLSKFGELLELGIKWTMKLMFSGVIGLNLVQGILGPALDTVGRRTIFKGMEMLPGVGDIVGGIGQIAAGAAALIKNGIGVGAAIICVMICLVPVMQTAVLVILYKGAAAVIQPISDRRITDCLSGIGDGFHMLLKLLLTSGVLFLITIAIVAVTTGTGGI